MMKRWLGALLAAALVAALSAGAEGAVNFWTTRDDPCYHADAGCPDCAEGAVRLSVEAAEAFGKAPCPACIPAAGPAEAAYNGYADTSHWSGTDIRLRETADGREEMDYPCLAGDWIYYMRSSYVGAEEDDWGDSAPSASAICRCRAADLSGEEVLAADLPANPSGLRDAGDGILLWYSEFVPGNTVFHFEKLGYEGGATEPLGEVCVKGSEYVNDLVVVGDTAYFSWCDCDLDVSTETNSGKMLYVAGEVYALPLSGGEPRRVFAEPRMIYDLNYADGRLLFTDHDDYGWYWCTLDPRTGKRRELLSTAEEFAGLHILSGVVVGGRLYAWDDDGQRTVSVNLDGSDLREVSKDHFSFRQVWRGGVLAARVAYDAPSGMAWEAGGTFYFPPADPANPAFDPDHGEASAVGGDAFILGDRRYESRDGVLAVVDPAI